MLIKVDNIYSVDMIDEYYDLNIDILTLHYEEDSKLDELQSIKNILKKDISLCLSFDKYFIENENILSEIVNQIRPDFIQLTGNLFFSERTIQELLSKNIKIIYEFSLDCDEEPIWAFPVFSSDISEKDIVKKFKNKNFYIQFNIMLNYEDGWEMIKNECGAFDTDLTINELNDFINEYQTFIRFNFSNSNINEIVKNLPNAVGLSFDASNKNILGVLKSYQGK